MKYKVVSIEFDTRFSPKEVQITATKTPLCLKEAKEVVSALENAHKDGIHVVVPIRATTQILRALQKSVLLTLQEEVLAKKARIAEAKLIRKNHAA